VSVGVSRAVIAKGRSQEHDRGARHLPILMNSVSEINEPESRRFWRPVRSGLNWDRITSEFSKTRVPNRRAARNAKIGEPRQKQLEIVDWLAGLGD
jgi:hypothetical protein